MDSLSTDSTALIPITISQTNCERQLGHITVQQRKSDGYFNAREICKIVEKRWDNFWARPRTKELQEMIAKDQKLPLESIVQVTHGAGGETWIHPLLAVELAHYGSTEFAYQVNKWAHDILEGQVETIVPEVVQHYDEKNQTQTTVLLLTRQKEELEKTVKYLTTMRDRLQQDNSALYQEIKEFPKSEALKVAEQKRIEAKENADREFWKWQQEEQRIEKKWERQQRREENDLRRCFGLPPLRKRAKIDY